MFNCKPVQTFFILYFEQPTCFCWFGYSGVSDTNLAVHSDFNLTAIPIILSPTWSFFNAHFFQATCTYIGFFFKTHVVISGSKTNSNFRRKTNLAGTSTVRVCNSASPRRAGWQIHNLQSRTAWKKKVAKASRVLAFEGMFIEQHTFLVIKSEIKQLFIFLCISYITLKLLLAEGLLIWTQRLFVLWNGLMNGLIRAKSPPNNTRFVSKLLCYVAMKAQ